MRSQFSRALSHFELFERDTRRAELSPPGRSLLPDARGDLTNGGNEESRQFGRQDRCAANLDCSRRIFRPRAPDCLRILQADVPEVSPGAIERHWLCETRMVTVCASTHPLATSSEPTTLEEFGRTRPLTFMISRRRGHDLSACEVRLIELLANAGAPCGKPS
jgi:DNA-binding transcriptional LysR family regulator